MIQRIQSVYLFLATLVLFALYLFPLINNVNVNGAISNISVQGVYQQLVEGRLYTIEFIAIKILTAPVAVLPTLAIFFYKKRKYQIALCYGIILAIIGFSFAVAQTVKGATGEGLQIEFSNMGIGMFLSSIAIILVIMAIKAIKRDEKLVRSADRLR
ncbi:DUF4293 domain-containing protein [Mucilaginibacter hurinus]|uniref:DUF4293 domain-containing protein n=1 Tax=Mucilaginibacter hurinus TaxID=2201324 RepID=A0A367GQ27_9SPHI|nr:DUF4293 domain-containing protein [Mucilaginibacter hurinus]RCH55564.1 DUF4293 domain-containing protein [Mucilaginibacter hurinus]